MGWVVLPEVREGLGTFQEIQDESEDPTGYPGRVGGHFLRSKMGRGTLLEVRVWSRDPSAGWDGSEDHHGGPRWVRGPSRSPGLVERPTRRSGSGRETPQRYWTGR